MLKILVLILYFANPEFPLVSPLTFQCSSSSNTSFNFNFKSIYMLLVVDLWVPVAGMGTGMPWIM